MIVSRHQSGTPVKNMISSMKEYFGLSSFKTALTTNDKAKKSANTNTSAIVSIGSIAQLF